MEEDEEESRTGKGKRWDGDKKERSKRRRAVEE